MSTATGPSDREYPDSPYRRDDYFGADDRDADLEGGHRDCQGTDPPEYLMFQQLAALTDRLCARTLREHDREAPLSDPCLYLPKQHETEHGYIEYRQHRHRRRVNEETGWINWGESTSTAVPEVEQDTYEQAVHNYLWENGVMLANTDDWLTYADRLYHDPQFNSKEALRKFIDVKRAYDAGDRSTIPD